MLLIWGVHRYILIAAAVLPAIFLMRYVYHSDRLEKESPFMLRRLVLSGILATFCAMITEQVCIWLLNCLVSRQNALYAILEFFVIVAFAEEGAKYIFLRRATWTSPEFNCQYDGVVYAVFVSLGFALWENISYVLNYGLTTAIARAVTAIPGHACFGVFMGVFYGIAKKYDYAGETGKSLFFRILTLIVPMLLHGAYDYIATLEQAQSGWYFFAFVAVLFIVSFILVKNTSKKDAPIYRHSVDPDSRS